MLFVTGSTGCPKGSYWASFPCRAPPKSVVTTVSPCRSGYDQVNTPPEPWIETVTPPGSPRVCSITAAALPTAAAGLMVQSGESLLSVNEYRTVVVDAGVMAVVAGMSSATARSHFSFVGAVSLIVTALPAVVTGAVRVCAHIAS